MLTNKPNPNYTVIWHPYILSPEIPPEGVAYRQITQNPYGKSIRPEKLDNAIYQRAKQLNLEINFTKMKQTPNSLDSHRMIKLASRYNQGSEMLDAIFRDYFTMGRDISKKSTLIKIGKKFGYDEIELKTYLNSDENITETLDQNQNAYHLGIHSIPTFIFNQKFLISGAQDRKILERMLDIAEHFSSKINELGINLIHPNFQKEYFTNGG